MFDAIIGNWEVAKSVSVVLSFIVVVSLVLMKAGSANFLRDRLWRTLGGKRFFYEAETQAFHQDIREIEHFRAEFSIKVHDANDIKLVRDWVSKNFIPPSLFIMGIRYIDFRNFENIKVPDGALILRLIGWVGACLFGVFVSIASLIMVSTPYAIVKFKANDDWFFYGQSHFKLALNGTKITLEDCKKNPVKVASLPEAEFYNADQLEQLCDGLGGDKEVKEFMDDSRSAQRVLGWPFLLFFAGFSLGSFCRVMASVAIERIRRIMVNNKLKKMFGDDAKCLNVWFRVFG